MSGNNSFQRAKPCVKLRRRDWAETLERAEWKRVPISAWVNRNVFSKSFNGSFRDECLNTHKFLSLQDVQDKTEPWRLEYIEERGAGSCRAGRVS